MIAGWATHEGIQAYADRFAAIEFVPLGATGLSASPAGFGGYRVSRGVAEHEQALRAALENGINLIDTSTNYADGGSESMVGHVLGEMIAAGALRRDQVVVVSKAGYLQGQNYTLSQERKQQGRGFEDLVEYSQGLEHCIHPGFLEDQLTRSLQRLNLETLDILLLHNPEYFLGWANKQGIDPGQARRQYDDRIRRAFAHLETEVARGRIRWYGVSSNTFPAAADDPEFTSLDDLFRQAGSVAQAHHFGVIQMPMNLLEPGAVLTRNQPGNQSVLSLARTSRLAVLINRPLNAIAGNHMVRLAEVSSEKDFTEDEIIQAINAFRKSEKTLGQKFLKPLDVPMPLKQRIAEQTAVGDQLKFYWRNFGSYERWRDVRAGFILPRVQGVFQYLEQHTAALDGLGEWIDEHGRRLNTVLAAVESLYVGQARRQVGELRRRVCRADSQWCQAETLSQMALRALRSTEGVSCVLVGMRRRDYVEDVLSELRRPIGRQDRESSWQALSTKADD